MSDKNIKVGTGIGYIKKMKGDILFNIGPDLLSQLLVNKTQSKIEFKNDMDTSHPPLPIRISKRDELISKYIKQLNNCTYLHIVGEIGMGKTQLCNLVVQKINKKVYWFRLRDFNSQIKSFLIELKNIIQNKGMSSFFKNKLRIKDNAVIVLDDLPNLNNIKIEKELVELVQLCKQHGIKIISSSNYPLGQNLSHRYPDLIKADKVKPFTDNDTLELLKAYNSPKDKYGYAPLINLFSDSHLSIIIPTISYFESKSWSVNFDDFFKNKFLDDEINNFQLIFKQSIPDEKTRELAYRLNIVGRTIYEEDIKNVSEVNPSIEYPFEKLNLLLNTFVYKESEKEYLLSPILYKLGTKNIDSKVEKSINIILGKNILNKSTLTPLELTKAVYYFINAKEYGFASGLLLQGLFQLILEKDIKYTDFIFPHIWVGMPIPNEVKIDTQLVLRASQIVIYEKFGNNTEKLYEDFYKIESQISSDSSALVVAYFALFLHGKKQNDFKKKLFNSIKNIPIEQREFLNENNIKQVINIEMLETLILTKFIYVNSYESLKKWLNDIKQIDTSTLQNILKQDTGKEVLNVIHTSIGNKLLSSSKDETIHEVYELLEEFSKSIVLPKLSNIYVTFKAISIECLARLHKYDKAEELLKNTIHKVGTNKEYNLVLTDGLCKRYIHENMYTEALSKYTTVINTDNYKNKNLICDAYTYAGIAYAHTNDNIKAKSVFEKAISLCKILDTEDNILLSRIYGEYSIVLWNLDLVDEYLDISKKILSILEKNIDNNNDLDTCKALIQIYGNNFGYVATSIIEGKPPSKIITGEDYKFFTNKAFFYYDKSGLLENYSDEKLSFMYYRHADLYYSLNKKSLGKKYLKKSLLNLEKNNNFNSIIARDAYLFQENYKNYYNTIKKSNLYIYLLPFFIKLNIDLLKGINNLERDKKDFIHILSNDLESKYYDVSIYIFDLLSKKESIVTKLENSDGLVQRLYFFSKLFDIISREAIKNHKIFLKEFFETQFKSLFSAILQKEIVEEYFFTFWIKKLETSSNSFKYASMLKGKIERIYCENIHTKEKCNKLLSLIDRSIKK